jgi:hypothetical protein
MVTSGPALTTILAFTVTIIWSVTALHGPAGSSVVSVTVTVPEVIDGVYTAAMFVVLEKEPVGADQVAEVAPPPNDPAKVIVPPEQSDWSTLAFTVAAGFTVTVVEAVLIHPAADVPVTL